MAELGLAGVGLAGLRFSGFGDGAS